MANNIKGKVWLLDTTGVISRDPVYVTGFVFVPAAADDAVVIKDSAATVILDIKAAAGTPEKQIVVMFGQPKWFEGMQLTTLTASAKIYVYTG